MAVPLAALLLSAAAPPGSDAAPGIGSAGAFPLGVNLSGVVDWSTEVAFNDVWKTSRAWVSNAEGKPWGRGGPLDLDDRGQVKSLRPGQFATTPVLTRGGYPGGDYTLAYDGAGEFRVKGRGVSVRPAGPGRVTVANPDGEKLLIDLIDTDPADPVRNVRLSLPGADESSGTFAAPFLARTGRFAAVRFMDWAETNGSEIAAWTDRPEPGDARYTGNGVPAEVMIELANELKVAPWFCVPHLADDDYVRRLAELVRDTLDPSLDVYVEHSNEVWNYQFAQTKYAEKRGAELGLSDNKGQARLFYHARRSGEIFAIWDDAFGPGAARVRGVLGSQSANPWVSERLLADPAVVRRADCLAIAPYFGHELGKPETAAEVAALDDAAFFARVDELVEAGAEKIAAHKRLADAAGLELVAYEGGQHLVGTRGAENIQALTDRLHAANRSDRMAAAYRRHLEIWGERGGGLYCLFASVAQPSKWGSWGLLESESQDPADAPKWRAVAERLPAD